MRIFICALLFSLKTFAAVDIAFVEIRDYYGNVVQLEPGGRFAHIAIAYQGGWLHAHPLRGVEVISNEKLAKLGTVTVQTLAQFDEPTANEVNKYLGKGYDSNYSWSDEKIYCAELVGKILRLTPEPMTFDTPAWGPGYKILDGELGLSPDDIDRILSTPLTRHIDSGDECVDALRKDPADLE